MSKSVVLSLVAIVIIFGLIGFSAIKVNDERFARLEGRFSGELQKLQAELAKSEGFDSARKKSLEQLPGSVEVVSTETQIIFKTQDDAKEQKEKEISTFSQLAPALVFGKYVLVLRSGASPLENYMEELEIPAELWEELIREQVEIVQPPKTYLDYIELEEVEPKSPESKKMRENNLALFRIPESMPPIPSFPFAIGDGEKLALMDELIISGPYITKGGPAEKPMNFGSLTMPNGIASLYSFKGLPDNHFMLRDGFPGRGYPIMKVGKEGHFELVGLSVASARGMRINEVFSIIKAETGVDLQDEEAARGTAR